MKQFALKIKIPFILGTFVLGIVSIYLFAGVFVSHSQTGIIEIGAKPAFAAEEGVQQLQDVGIAAYLDSGQTLDLADLSGTFEVVEDQTADYIIGSISLPNYEDQQNETFHAHAYVNTSGWIMVYFMDDAPASKIIDWKAYVNSGGSSLNTLLEVGLQKVASDVGVAADNPAFYHFRYPDATHMMMIGEFTGDSVYDQFRINLPSSNVYREVGWALFNQGSCCSGSYLNIEGITVEGSEIPYWAQRIAFGTLVLSPNQDHLIEMNEPGGLVIIYKEQ